MSASSINSGPAARRWEALETRRHPFTSAAEGCARVTIPSLFLPVGERNALNHEKITAYTPWQNIGARGVNNLAAKLLLTLLPPNESFFEYQLAQVVKDRLRNDDVLREEVERA